MPPPHRSRLLHRLGPTTIAPSDGTPNGDLLLEFISAPLWKAVVERCGDDTELLEAWLERFVLIWNTAVFEEMGMPRMESAERELDTYRQLADACLARKHSEFAGNLLMFADALVRRDERGRIEVHALAMRLPAPATTSTVAPYVARRPAESAGAALSKTERNRRKRERRRG